MDQSIAEFGSSSQELRPQERQIVRDKIGKALSFREAGPYDRKHFPINEQIAEEELVIRNADFFLGEEYDSLRKSGFGSGKVMHFSKILIRMV